MSAIIIVLLVTAFFIFLPALVIRKIMSSKPNEKERSETSESYYREIDDNTVDAVQNNKEEVQSNVDIKPVVHASSGISNRALDSDAVVRKLKGYDNVRLNEIINSTNIYNTEVVEKARAILGRREAWEQIKDLSDEKLLEITMTDSELYTENIIEAASMELYQRDSQLLRNQFAAIDSITLAAIADGTSPAPEGIRLAACKYSQQS
ncbi:MAG: hypothetical protein K2L73_06250 [Muribaculaceae bacterium]|nr:hypothetical protein [Muribaculaceae bacterium]